MGRHRRDEQYLGILGVPVPQPADVVIIGGGVTGLSTALHLAQARVGRVVVLERHHVGAGQSGRAAGVVLALVPDFPFETGQK